MKKKHLAAPTLMQTAMDLKDKVMDFAKKQPVLLAGIVILVFMVLSSYVSYLRAQEILPETPEAAAVQKPLVVKKGDTFIWIGMEVGELSKLIRKEFNIPGKIKGVFVVDEGTQLAQQHGIKAGDVIISISRKAVPTPNDFIKAANGVQYREGILLDVYRDGKSFYVTIPFAYQYGPLMGPNKKSWQLGSPVFGQAFPYGPVVR